jgi:tetratricopeptide (TPR) repeat protein
MILKDPQNEDAWVNKGWVHEEFGEYDLALGAYQKALDNNKASQIALINMASIYKRQGKYDAAESLYKIFIGFFPNSAQGYWNLAELYSTGKRGTVQDALGVLEQGVELTEDKGLQKELERLRAL